MKLQGKTAIITGGGRGLGRSAAIALAEEGADVAMMSRTAGELEDVADRIKAAGGKALAVPGDVSDTGHISRIVQETMTRFSGIDILVNNAAIIGPASFMKQAVPEEWRRTLDINLNAAAVFCRFCVPAMRKRGQGKIINIVSGLGRMPFPRFAAYAASKSGLIQLTRSLAEELKDENIQVNAVDPGVMNTRMQQDIRSLDISLMGNELQQRFSSLYEDNQLDNPDDIAKTIVFLVSPRADHINGEIVSGRKGELQ